MATLAETRTEDPASLVERLARKARAAQRMLAALPSAVKAAALEQAAAALREDAPKIIEANCVV